MSFISETNLCTTVSCVTAAAAILSSMDNTTNPCSDFYQFACGGWVRTNPIPDGKSMWGTFGKLEQQNQLVVKNVLGKLNYLQNIILKLNIIYTD